MYKDSDSKLSHNEGHIATKVTSAVVVQAREMQDDSDSELPHNDEVDIAREMQDDSDSEPSHEDSYSRMTEEEITSAVKELDVGHHQSESESESESKSESESESESESKGDAAGRVNQYAHALDGQTEEHAASQVKSCRIDSPDSLMEDSP
jgi:hypothetical protein